MQKFTNKHNLPQEVVKAIMKDRYTDIEDEDHDYSATKLVSPILQTVLCERHPNRLVLRDVIDYFPSFIGSMGHLLLEESWEESSDSLSERRLYYETNGFKISGKFDLYRNSQITDYKFTKVYKKIKGNLIDWERQLNIYGLILKKNKYPVKRINVIAFFLDWKEHEKYRKGYPEAPIMEIQIPLWTVKKQQAYISSRIKALRCSQKLSDDQIAEIYPCSREEMWQDLEGIAVMKENAQRATKVFQAEEEAKAYMNTLASNKYRLEYRWSIRKRCFKHCLAACVCPQHERLCAAENVPIGVSVTAPIF